MIIFEIYIITKLNYYEESVFSDKWFAMLKWFLPNDDIILIRNINGQVDPEDKSLKLIRLMLTRLTFLIHKSQQKK